MKRTGAGEGGGARLSIQISCLLGAILLAAPLRADPAGSAGGVNLVIESPAPGAVIESHMQMAELKGRASAKGSTSGNFDVMIVIDVSQSTREASGADVNGNGVVGEDPHLGLVMPGEYPDDVHSTDPGDTILHAEVKAAQTLLQGFDARRVRVGLVTFSGDVNPKTGRQLRPDQQDATLQVPLTDDYDRLRARLAAVGNEAPHGATDFAAGIRLATRELAGLPGSKSKRRPGAQRVMLFLTDGTPSFPVGLATVSDPGDLEAAVAAARLAHTAGIRINTYALGPDALTRPIGATEVARVTLGSFTPVEKPGAIVAALQSVSFANVEDVGVVNLTTRQNAPDVRLNPDGSFVAFVPVQEGSNRVLVNALASDGAEANREIDFQFHTKAVSDRTRERELQRLRRLNAELVRTLEAERIKQVRRRERMKREVEIHAAPPPSATPESRPQGAAGQQPSAGSR